MGVIDIDDFRFGLYKVKVSMHLKSLQYKATNNFRGNYHVATQIQEVLQALLNEVTLAETGSDLTTIIIKTFSDNLPLLGEVSFLSYITRVVEITEQNRSVADGITAILNALMDDPYCTSIGNTPLGTNVLSTLYERFLDNVKQTGQEHFLSWDAYNGLLDFGDFSKFWGDCPALMLCYKDELTALYIRICELI